ncbi:carbohydrate esterase family 1 protein [Xylariaceae sp. FL0594]|nr:carbohydrate esterase family 1 protein [Xylariaceae sp. FL0594]
MGFETKAAIHTFGGRLLKLSHQSSTTKTPMSVSVYLPPASLVTSSSPAATAVVKVPVLVYLSGLTCTPDNCAEKGFLHAAASKHNIAVVYPDTSPRGAGVAGEDESWDFGTGAGFYVDATTDKWRENYRMYSYIVDELLPGLFSADPAVSGAASSSGEGAGGVVLGEKLDRERVSITGHSMGGHGALTLYLKNPGLFRSVSAFAPIANPSKCPWGEKAFTGYLGAENKDEWKKHDATEILRAFEEWRGKQIPALIDVGTGDNFYKQGQLLPENFERAAEEAGVSGVKVRYQEGYDHSYYFISTFAQDHVDHAAKYLLA